MQKIKGFLIILCFFGLTIGSLVVANQIERTLPALRPYIAAFVGCIAGFSFYLLISSTLKRLKISLPSGMFRASDMVQGAAFAIGAFIISLFLLVQLGGSVEVFSFEFKDLLFQSFFQFRPAILEELGFRLGIVTIALFLFGEKQALVAGAIPFGALHLMNFVSGDPIYWEYILGTSAAGLFLTLVYLNFHLGGAIFAHYIWNVLASLTAKWSSLEQEQIEGSIGTLAILLLLSLVLYLRSKKFGLFKLHV